MYAMKKAAILLLMCLLGGHVMADQQTLRYVDALRFRMINQGFPGETYTPYTRIPAYLKDSIRTELWDRAKNSAGLAIRFRTDSRTIGVRYNLHSNFHMAHMADTGIKGTDLYILDDAGVWQYVNTNRPGKDSVQHKIYVENMDGRMHECMIYLPLYDGVNWMEIGVDSAAYIGMPEVDNPRHDKKIVGYGTSILHGGCASRTGMAASNIIQREMNMEFVNLGVSGEGKLVNAMAWAMTRIPDVAAYVVDPVPNCTKMQCDTLTYDFVKILRTQRPEVPIIMVEGPIYPYAKQDSFFHAYLPEKNEAFRKNYERLKDEDPDNLYYLSSDGLNGWNDEGTVDGIHLTDLGFRAYATKLEAVLKRAFRDQKRRSEGYQPMRYEDATHFRMINHAFDGETLTPYTRMTTGVQDSVIPAFWNLEKCSAGLAIRFRTNSKRVGARYRLLNDFHMSHMADTGTKGTDLYIYGKDNKWHYVATGKPTRDTLQDITYIENMDGEMHEFMLYLPLYDGIRWLEIGVDQDALLEQPKVNSPRQEKRVICYGPSTMQGGCASRTGMAGTSILQRRLNAEFVNLATSGVGRIWMPVARAMAAIPGHIDAFVLELLPNSTQEMVDSVAYDFVKTLRTAHPEALILLLENETYTYTHYDQEKKTLIPDKNAALRRAYERLRKEDKRNLVYLDGKPLTGPDEEGTVDGTHQTDLGYWAYADYLAPYLRKVLK